MRSSLPDPALRSAQPAPSNSQSSMNPSSAFFSQTSFAYLSTVILRRQVPHVTLTQTGVQRDPNRQGDRKAAERAKKSHVDG
jgi:hypothetical protein